MKKVFLLIFCISVLTGCDYVGNEVKNLIAYNKDKFQQVVSSLSGNDIGNLKARIDAFDYLDDTEFQLRLDGKFYHINTENLVSGVIRYTPENDVLSFFGYANPDNCYHQIEDGLKHGASIFLGDAGQILSEYNYSEGRMDGMVRSFSEQGDVLIEGQVESGVGAVGVWSVRYGGKMTPLHELLEIDKSDLPVFFKELALHWTENDMTTKFRFFVPDYRDRTHELANLPPHDFYSPKWEVLKGKIGRTDFLAQDWGRLAQ